MMVPGKTYLNLPELYEPYYVYLKDSGHCLLCVPQKFFETAREDILSMHRYEVPVPAKYVLEKQPAEYFGYLICEVPYLDDIGVFVDENYYEF